MTFELASESDRPMTPNERAELMRELHALREQAEPRTSERVWDVITKLSVAGVLAVGTWLTALNGRVADNDGRLEFIEKTRFTREDARVMATELTQNPPTWLRQAIQRIEASTTKIEAKVEVIDSRLHEVEGKIR